MGWMKTFLISSISSYYLKYDYQKILNVHSTCFMFFKNLFYWRIVDLQCYVNFCCTENCIMFLLDSMFPISVLRVSKVSISEIWRSYSQPIMKVSCEQEIIVCCFKPLGFGVVCYGSINNLAILSGSTWKRKSSRSEFPTYPPKSPWTSIFLLWTPHLYGQQPKISKSLRIFLVFWKEFCSSSHSEGE